MLEVFNMITVFTLCSANYLAHAITLEATRSRRHNPHVHFVIGSLVARSSAPGPGNYFFFFWHPYELIMVEDIGIPALPDMVDRYDVVQNLILAVKPFYIEHLYARDPNVQAVIYLDPVEYPRVFQFLGH